MVCCWWWVCFNRVWWVVGSGVRGVEYHMLAEARHKLLHTLPHTHTPYPRTPYTPHTPHTTHHTHPTNEQSRHTTVLGALGVCLAVLDCRGVVMSVGESKSEGEFTRPARCVGVCVRVRVCMGTLLCLCMSRFVVRACVRACVCACVRVCTYTVATK